MRRKILITGGCGQVGTALQAISCEYPEHEFIFSDSKDCDLIKIDETLHFVELHKPEAILHLAAVNGGIGLSLKYPAKVLRDNVYMTMNVLEAARIHGVRKTVMTLSSGMYPANAPNPLLEDYIHQGCPHSSNYSYAFAKRLIEPSIRAYRAEYRMNIIGLVLNGIIGENGNFSLSEAPMWAALIRRFYENRNDRRKLVVWGDGSPLREHTCSRDIAKAFMWCLDNYDDAQILNIGSTEEHSVKEIAYMIAEILGINKERIEFDTSRPAGIPKKSTDNSRFVKLSGFQYTPFRVALERTIRWFCENCNKPGNVRL